MQCDLLSYNLPPWFGMICSLRRILIPFTTLPVCASFQMILHSANLPGHAVEFGQISMLLSRGADCKIHANSQSSQFGQLGRPLANPQMGGLGTGSPSTGIPTLPLISWVQKKKKKTFRPIKYYLISWYYFHAHLWIILAGFIHVRLDVLTVGM